MNSTNLISAVFTLLIWCWIAPVQAQETEWSVVPPAYTPNAGITSVVLYGNSLLVAGTFSAWAPYNSGTAALDPVTGKPLARFPSFRRTNLVIADKGEGWITLEYNTDNDYRRVVRLQRIRRDFSIANIIMLRFESSGRSFVGITDMARKGDTLYLGGSFVRINDTVRSGVAALDLRTGEILPWNPIITPMGTIRLAVYRNSVFLQGFLDFVNGHPVQKMARVDAGTGELYPWSNPIPLYLQGFTNKIIVRDGILYADNGSIDIETGLPGPWKPEPYFPENPARPADIYGIDIDDQGRIFVAGDFTQMNGERRMGLAAFDAVTGVLLPWQTNVNSTYRKGDINEPWVPGTYSVEVAGDRVYIGGDFQEFEGQPIGKLVCVDANTGEMLDWHPLSVPWQLPFLNQYSVMYADSAIVVSWSEPWASVGYEYLPRSGFAEVDASTGAVLPWDPKFTIAPSNEILKLYRRVKLNSLVVHGTTLVAAGDFDSVAGAARQGLCAFDLKTRALLPWSAQINRGVINRVFYGDGAVYISGTFDSVNGSRRRFVAALDAESGELLPWDPEPDTLVNDLVVLNGRVYLGGVFDAVGGVERYGFGVVDAETGKLLEEGPVLRKDAAVELMLVDEDMIYLAGRGLKDEVIPIIPKFGLGYGIAGFDIKTGEVKWVPKYESPTNTTVYSIVIHNDEIIIAGVYQRKSASNTDPVNITDSLNTGITVFDRESGEIIRRGITSYAQASGIIIRNDTLTLWGEYGNVGEVYVPYLSYVVRNGSSSVDVPVEATKGQGGLRIYPNPSSGVVTIESDTEVSRRSREVLIYDSRGVEIQRGRLQGGRLVVTTEPFTSGVYFIRCGNTIRSFIISR